MVFDLIFFRFSCQILHGVATFLVMAYFCEVGVPEIIVPMLLQVFIGRVPLYFQPTKHHEMLI